VADLQDYARPILPVTKEVTLDNIINEMLRNLQIPQNIKILIDINKDAAILTADPDLLKRILGNLANNALQAMPEGGTLAIRAHRNTSSIVIRVQDTGKGIPEDIKPKLFTPLFTTKSKGQGFGLAVVKRLTEALGGTVTCESESGAGTVFIVRLPI
jgi:signal transduction histidine kinase